MYVLTNQLNTAIKISEIKSLLHQTRATDTLPALSAAETEPASTIFIQKLAVKASSCDNSPPGAETDMHSEDDHIDIMAAFPKPGLYKVFAQFRPKGIELPQDEALTASFWIKVVEAGSVPVADNVGRGAGVLGWWGEVFISLILIAALSWLVNTYIAVKK